MNVVIKVDDDTKKEMIEYYKDKMRDKKIPYVVFQAQEEDTVITMYESGKVMFQGTSAAVYADADDRLLKLCSHRHPLGCQPADGPELSGGYLHVGLLSQS